MIEKETGAFVVASPLQTIHIADDKWLTAEFLRERNLPYSESFVPANEAEAIAKAESWGYPLFLKARSGTSQRHVHRIQSSDQLRQYFGSVPKPMLQKMVAEPAPELSAEYTTSIFKCADGELLGPFTARRTLRGGNSWCVEVAPFEKLYP